MKKTALFITVTVLFLLCGAACAQQADMEPSLCINELMASNQNSLEDSFGRHPDWVELFNASDEAVSLDGMCLSDKKDELERYSFPDGLVLGPKEYLIVFCSGLKKNVEDELHTSFKLSAMGEAVYLSKDGQVIDSVLFEDMEPDVSLCRTGDGSYAVSKVPTPGAENQIVP